jgi:uncharacterized repeat protein (TIGR03803 family)
MKTHIKKLFLLSALVTGLGLILTVRVTAQTFTTLHSFTNNPDGANPYAGLILSGNTLYGTTQFGGSSGIGIVFAVKTDGMGFTNLYSFIGSSYEANPRASLILSGNTLYGTATYGGSLENGTVFAINTNGMGFTNLYSFTGGNDGANPFDGLILSGNTLYGTAFNAGSGESGTVFAVNTNGMGFTILHPFTEGSDGGYPFAGLILSGNTLYGTAYAGGTNGNGTVFSLTLASVGTPQLTIIPSGTNVILVWPTNAAGFTLEFATNLVSPVWKTNSPAPVVVSTNNVVTNTISGTQQFYRLSQ